MDYQLFGRSIHDDSKSINKGVHPDRNGYFSQKDHILLDWIEDAYATSYALN